MINFAEKIQRLNKELFKKVEEEADNKFGKDNSYVKNLWTEKEYKKRGGKSVYKEKKPKSEKIEKRLSKEAKSYSINISPQLQKIYIEKEILKYSESNLLEDEEKNDLFFDLDYLNDSNFKEEIIQDYLSFANKEEKLNEVFKKYHSLVNMSASELEAWSKNDCSKAASLSRSPITRNLRLLRKKKEEWTSKDISDANKTISFISRMSKAQNGKPVKYKGKSCPSKRDISLKNWAYNPNK